MELKAISMIKVKKLKNSVNLNMDGLKMLLNALEKERVMEILY